MPGRLVDRDLGLDVHLLEQGSQHGQPERQLLGVDLGRVLRVVRGTVRRALGGRADGVGAPGNLTLVDDRFRLLRALFLHERQQHARIDPAHAQHVRGLAPLQDLDIDLRSFSSELEHSALDGFFDGATGELFSTERHRVPPRVTSSCCGSADGALHGCSARPARPDRSR